MRAGRGKSEEKVTRRLKKRREEGCSIGTVVARISLKHSLAYLPQPRRSGARTADSVNLVTPAPLSPFPDNCLVASGKSALNYSLVIGDATHAQSP